MRRPPLNLQNQRFRAVGVVSAQTPGSAHRLHKTNEEMNRVQIHLSRMTCGGSGIDEGGIETRLFVYPRSVYRAVYMEPRQPAGYEQPIWPRVHSGWGNQAFKMRGPNPSLNWRNI